MAEALVGSWRRAAKKPDILHWRSDAAAVYIVGVIFVRAESVSVTRCVAVVKSADQSSRDDVSSTSSDYENPEDTATPKSKRAASNDDDGSDYELYDDASGGTGPVTQPAASRPAAPAAAPAIDEDDLIYECCDEMSSGTAGPVDDYGNMYYGRWDNAAADDRELSFRRGDLVKVVSRKFDQFGWWVGSLNGSVGLVPRDYLTPAYQLVDT